MNLKVCGITTIKQLQQLDAMDIDFAGLIFYKDSPRFVGSKIDPAEIQSADFELRKVGVFVNAKKDEILEKVESYGLDLVQLHGDESPKLCSQLSSEVEVIKAFRIGEGITDIDELVAPYDDACDYYLFDTGGSNLPGGTGKQFDWALLESASIEKPFFLGGGIGLEDAERIRGLKHPDLFCIDINSRFETLPGVKDMARVLQFRQALKQK